MRFDERLRRLERRLEPPEDLGRPPWFDSDEYLEECREACEGHPGDLARLEIMAEAHRRAREEYRAGKPWRLAKQDMLRENPMYLRACAGFYPTGWGWPKGTSDVIPVPEAGRPWLRNLPPTRPTRE